MLLSEVSSKVSTTSLSGGSSFHVKLKSAMYAGAIWSAVVNDTSSSWLMREFRAEGDGHQLHCVSIAPEHTRLTRYSSSYPSSSGLPVAGSQSFTTNFSVQENTTVGEHAARINMQVRLLSIRSDDTEQNTYTSSCRGAHLMLLLRLGQSLNMKRK